MPTAKRRAAEAAVAAGAAFPQPKGRRPKDYPIWNGERGCWVNDAGEEQPSAPSATVQPEPHEPQPQPMMEHVHTYTLGPGMPTIVGPGTVPLSQLGRHFAACEQQRGMNVSDAWGHALTATNAMICSIMPRVDDPDPETHMCYAMEERLGMHGLNPSDRVLGDEFWDNLRIGRRRRWSV